MIVIIVLVIIAIVLPVSMDVLYRWQEGATLTEAWAVYQDAGHAAQQNWREFVIWILITIASIVVLIGLELLRHKLESRFAREKLDEEPPNTA